MKDDVLGKGSFVVCLSRSRTKSRGKLEKNGGESVGIDLNGLEDASKTDFAFSSSPKQDTSSVSWKEKLGQVWNLLFLFVVVAAVCLGIVFFGDPEEGES